MRRPLALLAASLLLLVGAAGCSSKGSDDAAPTTTTSASAAGTDESTTAASDGTDTTDAGAAEESTTTGKATDVDEAGCAALKKIADFDVDSSKLINSGAGWPEIQAFFVDRTDDVLAAYDDAIKANPDLADELQTLRDYTDGLDDLAAQSESIEELGTKLTALPGTAAAGQAGLALNEHAESACGFSTGGN